MHCVAKSVRDTSVTLFSTRVLPDEAQIQKISSLGRVQTSANQN